MNVN
jgi:serine/threonine protein kinase